MTPSYRLTADDNLFVVMEQALGIPVINQAVWRLGPDVDAAFLDTLAENLRAGRLSRLVIRRRLPVRDRWIHSPRAGVHRFDAVPISPNAATDWATAQLTAPISSTTGPAWSLSATPTTDGHTLVSLVISHVVGDGAAVVAGITEAVRGTPSAPPTTTPSLAAGLRDGADLLRSAIWAGIGVLRAGGLPEGSPAPGGTPLPRHAPTTPASIAVTIDAAAFDGAAAAAGGTANTLFSALTLGILERTKRVKTGDTVALSLPMSTRVDTDPRANATTAVTASVLLTDSRYGDLTPIRTASKAAFAGLADGPDAMAHLVVVAQALPDAAVRRLAASTTTPLCLASNLGNLDSDFASLRSATVGPVAMRSLPVGVPADRLASMSGGISAWASRSTGLVTLCVGSLDPISVPDNTFLHGIVAAELTRWGLASRSWL